MKVSNWYYSRRTLDISQWCYSDEPAGPGSNSAPYEVHPSGNCQGKFLASSISAARKIKNEANIAYYILYYHLNIKKPESFYGDRNFTNYTNVSFRFISVKDFYLKRARNLFCRQKNKWINLLKTSIKLLSKNLVTENLLK